ncbi:MAG: four helix bundle protein [bacterium]
MSDDVTEYVQHASDALCLNEPAGRHAFDLEERTAQFGEAIIRFAKMVPRNCVTRTLIVQLVRAGTSPGSNYREANDTETRKDFRYRIGICKRESKETCYWLRMIVAAEPVVEGDSQALKSEAIELTRIFVSILRNTVTN